MFSAWTNKIQDRQAWDHFLKTGLPDKTWKAFRSVRRLPTLYQATYREPDRATLPYPVKANHLYFVNGRYQEQSSSPPPALHLLPLVQAQQHYGCFSPILEEADPFALLNRALASEAWCIYAPPFTKSHLVIHQQNTASHEPTLTVPRLYLLLGEHAELDCKLTHHTEHWVNSLIEVNVARHATLTLTSLFLHAAHSWHFDALRASLDRGSHFTSYAFTRGAAISRQDYHVNLKGEEASAALYGICHGEEQRHHHVQLHMEHYAPKSHSKQQFKHLLRDQAHASFEGKITIHPTAGESEAYQLHQSMLLSQAASIKSKPTLAIFAGDVKASHGATVGYCDEETLFYLQTRGLSRAAAQQLLIYGFCKDILQASALSEEEWNHVSL